MTRIVTAASVIMLPGCGGVDVEELTLDASFRAQVDVGGAVALLWLDTGAMGSDFYLDAARRIGLTVGSFPGRSVVLVDSSGVEREFTEFASSVYYRLGSARSHVDFVVCLPRDAGSDSHGSVDLSPRVDGHLGMDVMQHFVSWFDAPNGQVRVMTPDVAEHFLAGSGCTVAQRVRLTGNANRPMVRVRLQDAGEIELLLDTGADRTSLPAGIAGQLSLPSGTQLEAGRREAEERELRAQLQRQGLVDVEVTVRQDDGSSVGLHGVSTGPRPLFHLRSLRLGDREVRDLVVVEDARSPKLGRDVLGRFGWILHGPLHELWLLDRR
jgi:hypothetical protein